MSLAARSPLEMCTGHDRLAAGWVCSRRRVVLWMVLGAAVALALLWLSEYHGGGVPVQEAAYERFRTRTYRLSANELAVDFLASSVGSPWTAAATVAVLAVLLGRRFGLRTAVFVLVCGSVVAPEAALNALLGPSPTMLRLEPATAHNFPSGHAAYASALFGGLAVLALMRRQHDLAVVAGALAVLMGIARVVYAKHLLSDVLAGSALGIAWLGLALLATWGLRRPAVSA